MIVYHPAGELHAQSFDTSAVDLFRIEVNQARLRRPSHPDLSVAGCVTKGGPAAALARKLYQEFQEPDWVSHLVIEGLGLELLAALARDSLRGKKMARQPPLWLGRAYELIRANYLRNLALNDVAGAVGVHPVTLAREFRRHYQCTVGELVRRERIAFACRALIKTETSIAGVAARAGFYDQSHFAKVFKRLMGMTPKCYRDRFTSH
jgi:AraC-like DNA-binding protein